MCYAYHFENPREIMERWKKYRVVGKGGEEEEEEEGAR